MIIDVVFSCLQAWPDELSDKSFEGEMKQPFEAARHLRLANHLQAELYLLECERNSLVGSDFITFFRAYKILANAEKASFLKVFQSLSWQNPDSIFARIVRAQYYLMTDKFEMLRPEVFDWQEPEASEFLLNSKIAAYLALKQLDDAYMLIENYTTDDSLERSRLRARYHTLIGHYEVAVSLLENALQRAPLNILLHQQLCELVFDAEDGQRALPVVHAALNKFGEHPLFMPFVARAKLHQREPSFALRAKLMERCWLTLDQRNTSQDGNLLNAYDHLGRTDWLAHLPLTWKINKINTLDLQSNLCMQLSSAQACEYPTHATQLVNEFVSYPQFLQHLNAQPLPLVCDHLPRSEEEPLDVIWVTGDLCNHPVCRFMLGFFYHGQNSRRLRHRVVALRKPAPLFKGFFENQLGIEVVDVSGFNAESKTEALRSLQAHVAVDLSGWTGGNHVTAFMARIAPIQVNYLGYHASTGIPNVDYWLGDSNLFPADMKEWHTEKVWRLSRPFIAWNPPPFLIESEVACTPSPESTSIRFGCFNHFRKISDGCLAVWARILRALPEARLVLKGTTSFDSGSTELTRRRFMRQGVDLNRIDWLPLTPTPLEHLRQYCSMDIALDTFPNSGCTTSCEALWMGVPVLTLAGSGYVSRMSTAVVKAAGLDAWVACSHDEYVSLAVKHAQELAQLRENRSKWRQQLQSTPLGDAAGLFTALENAFIEMTADKIHSNPFAQLG